VPDKESNGLKFELGYRYEKKRKFMGSSEKTG
jgi:hypothetical protein